MEQAPTNFTYEPLPADGSQIRLVTILPGIESEALRCTVRNFVLTEDLQYEALSYSWGDPAVTSPVLLNGSEFQCTTNLEAALQSLRYEDKERMLWIDAICINQRSISERNTEVRRMDVIYKRAERVVVWLGREIEPGDIIGAGDPLINAASTLTVELLEMLSEAKEEWDVLNVLHQTGSDILALQVLGRLFCRPWFLRTWIVQEVALAKTVTVAFGPQRIAWDRFIRAVDTLHSLEDGLNKHLWRLSGAFRVANVQWCRSEAAKEQSMSTSAAIQLDLLLWKLRASQVTDSRDRLFGTLGLVRHGRSDPLLAIDYRKSVPDVFRDLSIYLIQHGLLADVLCAVTHKIEGLPHWAALWAAPLDSAEEAQNPSSKISFGLGVYMALSRSRGSEAARARFSEGGRKLTVRGTLLESVVLVCQGHDFSGDDESSLDERLESFRAHLLSWEDEMESCGLCHREFPTRELRVKIWKEVLFHEVEEDSWIEEHYDRLLGRAVSSKGETWSSIPSVKDSAAATRLVTELQLTFGRRSTLRRPFITVNGLMGSTGSTCEVLVGDVVCVLVGCAMPFLLRPVKGTQDVFRFVACCFVPGLMDLDLLDETSGAAFDVEDICLI